MNADRARRWEKNRAGGMLAYIVGHGLLYMLVLMILTIVLAEIVLASRWSGDRHITSSIVLVFPYLAYPAFLVAVVTAYAGERSYAKYLALHGQQAVPSGTAVTPGRRRFLYGLLLAALILPGVAHALQNRRPPDLSQDEPPFCDLVLPPRSVKGEMIPGGDGFLITVVDRNGGPYEFIVPRTTTNPSLHYGARNLRDPAARPLSDDARGRDICLRLLTDYRRFGDETSMEIQHALAGDKPAYLTRVVYRFLSRF
ncbi:MAG: hypothetical protein EOP87_13730 [Verrucomicrobiaceae bacterium]|nr:MAG: hypothetical protein EOP87_13730 [Verrucomicrobiaceae bacterium]